MEEGSNQEKSPTTKSDKPPDSPGHLAMFNMASKQYKGYVERLKQGFSSGISGIFGRAGDILLAPRVGPDIGKLDIAGEDELKGRVLFLAWKARQESIDFLRSFFKNCQDGIYGAQLQKFDKRSLDRAAIDANLKAIACTCIYLMHLEQGDQVPEWFSTFIGTAMAVIDQLMPGPSNDELTKSFEATIGNTCSSVAADFCLRFDLRSYGVAAYSPVAEYLLDNEHKHNAIVRFALENPLMEVLEQQQILESTK